MRVLITNDDGIHAEGIQVLSQTLSQETGLEIFLVAPDHERSATSHAITMHRPLRTEKVKFLHNPTLTGWSVNGTPSDCVKLAVEYLLPGKPDLVISGINRGGNLGTDVLYSGTVSAAIEGTILGIPSIAVSLTKYHDPDFSFAAKFALYLLHNLNHLDLPQDTLLNINVPGVEPKEIKGVRITRLGTRHYHNSFQKRQDPRGRNYYWLAGEIVEKADETEDADVMAIKNNYISITPLHFNLTNYKLIEKLRTFNWNI